MTTANTPSEDGTATPAVGIPLDRQVRARRGPWKCFHCGEMMHSEWRAAEHFGETMAQEPACTIDVAEYRRMEAVHRRHCDDDTDLHRQIARMESDHQRALMRAEEEGYAKGLRDAGQAMQAQQQDIRAAIREAEGA